VADPVACAEILAQVRHLTGKPQAGERESETEKRTAAPTAAASAGRMREWHIALPPAPT